MRNGPQGKNVRVGKDTECVHMISEIQLASPGNRTVTSEHVVFVKKRPCVTGEGHPGMTFQTDCKPFVYSAEMQTSHDCIMMLHSAS